MKFDTRHACHQSIVQTADTSRLRELFHVSGLFMPDDVSLTFSHIERMIVGGVMPVSKTVELNEVPALNKGPFLARRELGVINIGGPGKVTVDGKVITKPDFFVRRTAIIKLTAKQQYVSRAGLKLESVAELQVGAT